MLKDSRNLNNRKLGEHVDMRRLLIQASKAALLGAIIGAIAGFVTFEFSLDGAPYGGIIGALIGAGMAAWIDARRDAAKRAIRDHTRGTRSVDVIEKENMLGPRGQDLHGPYR